MVQHPGEAISKDDFLKTIWTDRYVEEGILTVHVSALRKVLGENNGDDQYIETVPRVGYRFVAQVQEVIGNGRSLSPRVFAVGNTIEQSVPLNRERPAALQVVKHTVAYWIGLSFIVVLAVIGITALMFRSYLRAAPKLAESAFQRTKFTRMTTSGNNRTAVISPDGRFVSCLYLDESDGKKNWKIAMVPFDGGRPVKLFDVRPFPLSFAPLPWTSGGNSLLYLAGKNGVSNIMQLTIKSGESRPLTNFTSDRIFYFDWSRDGKRLAIARGKVNEDVVLISDLQQ